jgi:hypothetical protein
MIDKLQELKKFRDEAVTKWVKQYTQN